MKTLLLSSFTFLSILSFSQNVTFDQVQNLRKKTLAEVESFLTTKGWSMTDAVEEEEGKMGKATFGYNLDPFDSEKAASWISFYESSLGIEYNRISIQVLKPSIYSMFLTRLTANKYKLVSSKIENGAIRKIYRNGMTTCVVRIATTEGNYTKSTAYSFFFIDNFSYALDFEKED